MVELSPIQQKFLEHFSFQCGYCTPGFVNAATVLIERLKREPIAKADVERTITEALDAHLAAARAMSATTKPSGRGADDAGTREGRRMKRTFAHRVARGLRSPRSRPCALLLARLRPP